MVSEKGGKMLVIECSLRCGNICFLPLHSLTLHLYCVQWCCCLLTDSWRDAFGELPHGGSLNRECSASPHFTELPVRISLYTAAACCLNITTYLGDSCCSEVCNSFWQYVEIFICACDKASRVKSVKVRRCTSLFALLHLSDRTVGAVLSSLANFGTSDFGAPIHTPPDPHPLHSHTAPRRLKATRSDSHAHAQAHTLTHAERISWNSSRTRRQRGGWWGTMGRTSVMRGCTPSTHNGERGPASGAFLSSLSFPGRLLHLTMVLLSPRCFFFPSV